jgi:hypothetical protein
MTSRDQNLAKMQAWIKAMRVNAAKQDDPDAYLMSWHTELGLLMSHLPSEATELVGLTAWDLGEAQIALIKPLEETA